MDGAVKVTSVGSTSGAPSPPNPSPRTDYTENFQPTDIDAVGRILAPIQEDLNEQAEAAMYPSPPINTPETFSPAASVYKTGRVRGFSLLGDRLNQLKLEERNSPLKDTDAGSNNRSVAPSTAESEPEAMSDASFLNKCPTPVNTVVGAAEEGTIHIALGSPAINPRQEEYANFPIDGFVLDRPDPMGSSPSRTTVVHDYIHSRDTSIKSFKTDSGGSGVTEKSNWADEVEDIADRAILQLEQLAEDEHETNPSRPLEDYYVERLQKLLMASRRRVKTRVTYVPVSAESVDLE